MQTKTFRNGETVVVDEADDDVLSDEEEKENMNVFNMGRTVAQPKSRKGVLSPVHEGEEKVEMED
jgi:hypothetical protein